VYQAAIELADEEFERTDLARALESTPTPPPVSPWWLLLPPVAVALHLQRRRQWRRALLGALTRLELERLMHFSETATAWLFVAAGAFLIAVKETWDLHEDYGWSTTAFVVIVLVMVIVCVGNTAIRMRRRQAILAQARND
jgi:hypothetical protein